jgi:ubiquinone/menaquinone biosynthesis C-methylase UbiE
MSLYGRIFAGMYDRMMLATEDAGLRDRRRALLARADGRVLELGAGTGVNLPLYPEGGFSELVVTEPEEPMARRLEERARAASQVSRVVRAPAEDLPFDDASFDTVVSTLVLCTVADQDAALREARRVLKDGGRLLFMEHVRSDDPARAKWQDRLHGPWKAIGHGCNCNRATVPAIEASGFRLVDLEHGTMPKSPKIVRRLAIGVAVTA